VRSSDSTNNFHIVDRVRVSLHVKIFHRFCIQGFSISWDATDRARVSLHVKMYALNHYQLFYWDAIQTEYVYLYMLKYLMDFVCNDSVSVILLKWNTDRVRVSLHVKIFDGFCTKWFSSGYSTEMEYRQSTCNFTC